MDSSNSISRNLALLSKTSHLLAEATSVEETLEVCSLAETARVYARTAKLGLQMQNQATELKLHAMRKLGELLRSAKLHGGNRKSRSNGTTLKLADLGINKSQSSRWQRLAVIPTTEFEQFVANCNQLGEELSESAALRFARSLQEESTQAPRTYSRKRKPKRYEGKTAPDGPEYLIKELKNHRRQLANLLQPVYENTNDEIELTSGERKFVGRALADMDELLRELELMWADRPSDDHRSA